MENLNNKTIEITGYEGDEEVLVIPESINGLTVDKINDLAFKDCTFKELTIPHTVTYIGKTILEGCNNLEVLYTPYIRDFYSSSESYPTTLKKVIVTKENYFQFMITLPYVEEIRVTVDIEKFDVWSLTECTNLKTVFLPANIITLRYYDKIEGVSFFYEGTYDDYQKIYSIGEEGYINLYIYSENAPTKDGNYWHYVDGVPTIW